MTAGTRPIRDTRWSIGGVNLEGQLPAALLERQGLVPFRCTIDPRVPDECALALLDRQLTKKDYASMGGLRLEVRSAAEQTGQGAIGVLMFGFVPSTADEPAVILPVHLDAESLAQATWLGELAGQSHLHLLIIGRGKKVLDVLQLENTYRLDEVRSALRTALEGRRGNSRAALEALYAGRTVLDLWNEVAEHAAGSAGPPPGEREARPLADYTMLVVGREDIEAGDASEILAIFDKLRTGPDRGRASMGTVDLVVGGYDHDPRELYQIPEARRWFKRFIDATPDLFFFLPEYSKTAMAAMFATSEYKVRKDGRPMLDIASARAFVQRQIDGASRTMRAAGIDPTGPVARRHFDAILRPFGP